MSGSGSDFLQMFRDDAEERLDRMVDLLLALERGGGDGATIDDLFRDAHSIKGNAGMVGLDDVASIAHAVEDVFADARERRELEPGLAPALIDAVDALRRAVEGEAGNAAEAIERLSASRAQPASPDPDPDAAPATPAHAEEPAARAPESRTGSMRVASGKVDRLLDAVGEVVLHRRRLEHDIADVEADRHQTIEDELGRGEALLDELQQAVVRLRMLPLDSITGPFPRAVRDAAAAHGKEAELVVRGGDVQLDRVILGAITQALTQLLRNAVAHGIEAPDERERAGKPRAGRVELRAEQRGDRVAIDVADDGRGVDRDLLRRAPDPVALAELLSQSGLSTTGTVTELSGRGVGLGAVRSQVEEAGGALEVRSRPGSGTTVTLLLPVSLALLEVMLVERDGAVLGVPLASVPEVVSIDQTMSLGGRVSVESRGGALPLVDLLTAVGGAPRHAGDDGVALVVRTRAGLVALACDRVIGQEQVVVKSLGALLADLRGYLGAAILGDGRVAPIVDPAEIAATGAEAPARPAAHAEAAAPRVLVVDDQFTARELQRSILEAAGYEVETARDGREAHGIIRRNGGVDLVVTDLEMPEMDGLELLTAIRNGPGNTALPVVIVTSRGSDEDRRRGLELGADAYIAKDRFDQAALIETVHRLVGR